jgi:uncharacterized protein
VKKFYHDFKNQIVTVIIIFIAVFVYFKIVGPIPFFINSVQTTKTDLFTSSGEGKVTAIPDEATVNVGVTSQSETVADAQTKVNEAADRIIKDLKKLGLSDKDIKTTNYSVNPDYGTPKPLTQAMPMTIALDSRQQIVGYTVTQNLEIKVKPIEKANKVIDTATADGANLIGSINFTFSDSLQKSLEQKATKLAVTDAKQKAETLANTSGIRLGKIINVIESSNSPRPMMFAAGSMAKTDQVAVPETNITPGENNLTVNVTLYYETY